MASLNKITIIGNLGRDAELRYSQQGGAITSFSVAVTEKSKRDGEAQEITTWFKCTLFGERAEKLVEYLKKGKSVYVEGRFKLEEWTDKDGQKRTTPAINVNEIQLLGSRNEGGEASTPAQPSARAQWAGGWGSGSQRPAKSQAQMQADEQDIPF